MLNTHTQNCHYHPVKLWALENGGEKSVCGCVSGCIDYTSFGMTMPGKSWTASGTGYRYGFNGKELDPVGMGGGGSTYDYGFRIYNAQIAKFLSVDPLAASYPWYTPYQFAGNKPIMAIDLDGLEEYVVEQYYKNNKLIGMTLIHVPEKNRILKEANSSDKYNGIMYIEYHINPNAQFSTDEEQYKVLGTVTLDNFKNIARLNKTTYSDSFEPREQALMSGLEINYSEKHQRLINYLTDILVPFYNADNVQFENNSFELLPKYRNEVDKLIYYMKLFPNSTFEIGAHTDNVGTDEENVTLSKNRAQSIVDYMVNRGIDSARLTSVGYGESKPISDNNTDEGRSQNRRVEFTIIDKGY